MIVRKVVEYIIPNTSEGRSLALVMENNFKKEDDSRLVSNIRYTDGIVLIVEQIEEL